MRDAGAGTDTDADTGTDTGTDADTDADALHALVARTSTHARTLAAVAPRW